MLELEGTWGASGPTRPFTNEDGCTERERENLEGGRVGAAGEPELGFGFPLTWLFSVMARKEEGRPHMSCRNLSRKAIARLDGTSVTSWCQQGVSGYHAPRSSCREGGLDCSFHLPVWLLLLLYQSQALGQIWCFSQLSVLWGSSWAAPQWDLLIFCRSWVICVLVLVWVPLLPHS